jgi:hypothetical protein
VKWKSAASEAGPWRALPAGQVTGERWQVKRDLWGRYRSQVNSIKYDYVIAAIFRVITLSRMSRCAAEFQSRGSIWRMAYRLVSNGRRLRARLLVRAQSTVSTVRRGTLTEKLAADGCRRVQLSCESVFADLKLRLGVRGSEMAPTVFIYPQPFFWNVE